MTELPGVHDGDLTEGNLGADPIARFRSWFDEARDAGIRFPDAVALATADAQGRPAVRHVLLKGVDDRGFTFFTNRDSRKGRHLAARPGAALAVLWRELDRQVCVTGTAAPIADEESDAYFATRLRGAQLGAWASRQSQPVGSREELEAAFERVAERFPGEVPRPPNWGGYRLEPETIEFWKGRTHRLHDRFRYTREADRWRLERLWP